MRRSIKKFFTISTIAFVILYPCLFMYFQNADEAKLIDALPAFEKFLALAIVVFIICIIFMKNTGKAVLASDVILFILTNFNVFLSKVDHVIGRKKIIVILFFIIFMFMILVKKKIRSEQKYLYVDWNIFSGTNCNEFFCGASNNMLKTKLSKSGKFREYRICV